VRSNDTIPAAVTGAGAGAASKALSKKQQVELQSGTEFEVQVFRN
jgi:hypothetical protein